MGMWSRLIWHIVLKVPNPGDEATINVDELIVNGWITTRHGTNPFRARTRTYWSKRRKYFTDAGLELILRDDPKLWHFRVRRL